MELAAIRLENVRVFQGENVIPVGPGLTVLMGRNNVGKSTILRAPFMFIGTSSQRAMYGYFQRAGCDTGSVGLQFSFTSQECSAMLGFAVARASDIQIMENRDAQSYPLSGIDSFRDWHLSPVVELGCSWRGNSSVRTLRLVSHKHPEQNWVEVNGRGDEARATIEGKPQLSNARHEWFTSALQHALLNAETGLTPDLVAHWEHERPEAISKWIEQSKRRVVDTEESRLQETLTFLKMKHSDEFDAISRSLKSALPEFARLDFIDTKGTGFDYRPGFVSAGAGPRALAREEIGTGAWSYLCIVTAARAAKATGARVLFLDEPQIHMHPGLERLLVQELLDESRWAGKPLQIVVSTHSPAFVNAAANGGVLNVIALAR